MEFGRTTTTTTGGVRPHCVRVRCGVRAALGKLRLRARKRALAFDVSPTPQKHSGKRFRDGFFWKVQVCLNGHKILTKLPTIRCHDITVNFGFKHVRFREVFQFKEEFHCSQNFST